MELLQINNRYFKTKEKALKYEKWYKSRGYNAGYRKTMDAKLINKGFGHAVIVLHFGYTKTVKCKNCNQSWDRKLSVTSKGTATYVD